MRPGWHRVFWPNNRAVVVWLWPGVSGRAAIVSGGFSSACHDGIVKNRLLAGLPHCHRKTGFSALLGILTGLAS
jgi:hypothetical protein